MRTFLNQSGNVLLAYVSPTGSDLDQIVLPGVQLAGVDLIGADLGMANFGGDKSAGRGSLLGGLVRNQPEGSRSLRSKA